MLRLGLALIIAGLVANLVCVSAVVIADYKINILPYGCAAYGILALGMVLFFVSKVRDEQRKR